MGVKVEVFKWVYFDKKGNQLGEPVWQMKQSEVVDAITNKYSGYYSGPGSITKFGPGLSSGDYKELNNDYNFSYTPMSHADAISKEHDLSQNIGISQPQGWLEDVRTLPSDMVLLYKAKNALFQGGSQEDNNRISNMYTPFNHVYTYKVWKIGEMKRQKIDPTQPGNQLKIIFSDWHPKFFSNEWIAKQLLGRSGGGTKDSERNTIKPIAKKTP